MKVLVGQNCKTNKDCINNNCINNICTRRPRKKNLKIKTIKAQTIKAQRAKANNKKVKIGEKCQTNKDCINNNCVNGICTRKARVKRIKAKSIKAKSIMPKRRNFNFIRNNDIAPVNVNSKKKTVKKKNNIVKTTKKITQSEELSIRFGLKTPKRRPMQLNDFYVVPDTEEMMKIQNNLSEIGVSNKSFFFDPCYFLKNLNKILKAPKFTQFKYDRVLLLPVIYPKKNDYRVNNYEKQNMKNKAEFNRNMKNAVLGDKKLSINLDSKNIVGKGSYGVIYKSSIDKKDIVIKIPKENNYEDDLDENIIQNELFCAMRGNWSTGARIPKIEYIGRLYIPDGGSSSVVELKIITGMEIMEGNLLQFINNVLPTFKIDDVNKILKDMFIQICELLIKLQDKYDFHHRDFHMGNIMYNNFGTKTNPKYKWYIIDFGFSYMNIDGRKYHADGINMYRKYKSANKSFDLRLLFTNIYELERLTDTHPGCKSINLISSICKQLYRNYIFRLNINLNQFATPWHASYDTFDNKLETDKFTDPRNFIKMIKKL